MNLNINGKTALVTGAGRGLGFSICSNLAHEGVRIIAVSRTQSDLELLISRLKDTNNNFYLPLDIASPSGPDQLIKFLEEKCLYPDIIVNNLGGTLDFTDPFGSIDEFRQVMRLNVEVAMEINNALIPHMRDQKWGRICHVSSISAIENQGPPSYCAAKAALNAYVRSLGRYVSSDNVIMTTIMPGAILTKDGYWDLILKNNPEIIDKFIMERMAIKRLGSPEDISQFVTFLCSEHASFCAGSAFLADGGQGRSFYPSFI